VISSQAWADAQELWDFQQMGHELRPCSVAIGLGSHDLGVAEVTADLYPRGLTPLIVFTGATSRTTREAMPKGEEQAFLRPQQYHGDAGDQPYIQFPGRTSFHVVRLPTAGNFSIGSFSLTSTLFGPRLMPTPHPRQQQH
jgi:hypothetical protein